MPVEPLAGVNFPSRFCLGLPSSSDSSKRILLRKGRSPKARARVYALSISPWHAVCPLRDPKCVLGPFPLPYSAQPDARSLSGLPASNAPSHPLLPVRTGSLRDLRTGLRAKIPETLRLLATVSPGGDHPVPGVWRFTQRFRQDSMRSVRNRTDPPGQG